MSIVRLEEVFYAEGKVLMVLEYLPGGDLFDGLVSRPFYSEKDACACAHQIITALNYLSEKGIIHRVRNNSRGGGDSSMCRWVGINGNFERNWVCSNFTLKLILYAWVYLKYTVFSQILVFCMILRVNFGYTRYMFSGILVYHLPTWPTLI